MFALSTMVVVLLALQTVAHRGADAKEMAPSLFNYSWTVGSLPGPDVAPAALHTRQSAEEFCTSLPHCRAFCYVGSNTSSGRQLTRFTASSRANGSDATSSSWIKLGLLTPPALIVPVGQSNLTLALRTSAFSVQSLGPHTDPWKQNFSFVRALEGSTLPWQAHVGDITIRLQEDGDGPAVPGCNLSRWSTYSSALGIGVPAEPIQTTDPHILASHDITALLARSATNESTPFPLRVTRTYQVSNDGLALIIGFNISLNASATVAAHIGGLGFPMPEGSGAGSLNPTSKGIETSSWNEAHIGGEHGFVEYVRVVDDEATLLVTAAPGYHNTSKLEAWRPMLEDEGPGGWNNEWCVHSTAWAEEWACNRQSPFMDMADNYKPFYPEATRATPWPCADGTASMPKLDTAKYPWNVPSSKLLQPGESFFVAFRLQRAPPGANSLDTNVTGPGPRTRNMALQSMGEPVLHGVPGYVLTSEMKSAHLLVLPPKYSTILNVIAEAVGDGGATINVGAPNAVQNSTGYFRVPLAVPVGEARGRVRITARYSDGTYSTVHYYIVPPFRTQVERLGYHMAHVAWLPRDYPDPFGRSASVMPWDRSANGGVGAHVMNDARAYDVGLSDDAGGGNPLCLASKVHAAPRQDEVAQVDEFIKWTLYGIKKDTAKPPYKSLQVGGDPATGCHGNNSDAYYCDGVRMTMYYYARECDLHTYCKKYNCTLPPGNTSGYWPWNYTEVDKCSGLSPVHPWCMDEKMANATYRAFNYPHHTASYWAMYHVARYYDKMSTHQPWQWYLERAAKTALRFSCGTGVMDGTVFREVLNALKIEGKQNSTMASWAVQLDSRMRGCQEHWARQRFPYGSEFAFDTTGQEEVVVWNMYYGNQVAAKATVDHILSYMRSIPSWAYNGGARAADSGNNGKYMPSMGTGKPDRGQMHYRSGLNMIPLLEWYRQHPDDYFLLEVAMGAITGQMTNIDRTGATSMFFHAYPWVMDFDPHSGDYGLGFFGNALETGAYYIEHPRLGPLCYLCTSSQQNASTLINPEDAYRKRVFIAPLALYVVVKAGTIAHVKVHNSPSRQVEVTFNATEFGDRPWSRLQFSVETTTMAQAVVNTTTNCSVSMAGHPLQPTTTGTHSYAVVPAVSAGAVVLLSC